MVAEVWDILNVGPRNRYCANGAIVANCAIYRGGMCKNCGYEPTPRERRAEGLEFDGTELKEIKRKEKKKTTKSVNDLMVKSLYTAGKSRLNWRQCCGIFKGLCNNQGTPHRVPSHVYVAGHRYQMLRFGSENSGRGVSMLYPFTVGGDHGGEYLFEERESMEAPY